MARIPPKNLSNGSKSDVLKNILKIQQAVQGLRPHLPGKTDLQIVDIALRSSSDGLFTTESKRLDAEKVEESFRTSQVFSTQDVADRFKVRPQQAAAALAICRLRGRLDPSHGKNAHGSSLWRFRSS